MFGEKLSQPNLYEYNIYTDGACKNLNLINHKFSNTFGGWAYIITLDDKVIKADSGGSNDTTNNIMELTAVINALKKIQEYRRPGDKVNIITDSAYIVQCADQKWYHKWMKNGWVNANGKDVKNQDLWWELIPYFENLWYTFKKIKGHDGDKFNEMCDKMASEQATWRRDTWRGTANA